jgi:hypothetical protein
MADERRWLPANRFSLDEGRGCVSSKLFSLEEDRCQRSMVRCQRKVFRCRRTTARFVVDEDGVLGSASVARGPAPRFPPETSPDFVPLIELIGKKAIS